MKIILPCVLSLFTSLLALAQSSQPTTSITQQQTAFAVGLFEKATQADAPLLNGPEYVDYRKAYKEWHQYFEQESAAPGTVTYNGTLYQNVPMLYDLKTDEVIITREGTLKQKLVSEKVEGFYLRGHTFIRITAQDSSSGLSLRPGFYDLLLDGSTRMLVKRSKHIKLVKEDLSILEKFEPEEKFYLQKQGITFHVKSKGSVLKVFEDRKKELKKFAQQNKLRFRENRENAILALATHYISLNQ